MAEFAEKAGFVRSDEALTLRAFKARLEWSDSAVRSARRKGLIVRKCGKQRFVIGRDFLRFLEEQQADD